jgi:hypothetical protein
MHIVQLHELCDNNHFKTLYHVTKNVGQQKWDVLEMKSEAWTEVPLVLDQITIFYTAWMPGVSVKWSNSQRLLIGIEWSSFTLTFHQRSLINLIPGDSLLWDLESAQSKFQSFVQQQAKMYASKRNRFRFDTIQHVFSVFTLARNCLHWCKKICALKERGIEKNIPKTLA